MTDNHFDMVLVWDHLGSSVRVKPFGQAQVLDPATNVPVTVVQNGQSSSVVTADGTGRASFVAQQGLLKLVSGGLVQLVTSPEAATQGAANAAAAQSAQAAAQTAQAAAEKAAADAKTNSSAVANSSIDTHLGGDATNLVTTVAGNTSAIAATQAQQTQLMAVTPTVDELVQSVHITNSQTNTQTQTGTNSRTIWIAPFPCKIVAMTLAFQTYTQALDAANYWEFALRRLRAGGATSDFIVSKKTNGEAIAPLTPWRFSGATWNATNQVFAEGDLLSLNMLLTGAATPVAYPMTATFRYVPL